MAPGNIPSRYRSHTCDELRGTHAGQEVLLAGWIFRKRNHGNLLFIDLRDHYGVTQCVVDVQHGALEQAQGLRLESVVSLRGKVVLRGEAMKNAAMTTGDVELQVAALEVLSPAQVLPFPIDQTTPPSAQGGPAPAGPGTPHAPEEQRLRYRFLDLRRKKLHQNIVLRSRIIASLRKSLQEAGFLEQATPILTSSSPEGARDYLVPSRVHPGKFYALPQAPQQFKQLLMVSGFDRYFQIAPCFRDEDARADRSPGEFYQLDMEMAFVEQDDVFATIEPILSALYRDHTTWEVSRPPFVRLPYDQALLRYGSDKPDLRNPLAYTDVTPLFANAGFVAFRDAVAKGAVVRALRVPGGAHKSRRFFDEGQKLVRAQGLPGMAYITLPTQAGQEAKGPLAKFLGAAERAQLDQATRTAKEAVTQQTTAAPAQEQDDAVLFLCGLPKDILKAQDKLRQYAGEQCELIAQNCYRFLWVVDFPFYERDDDGKLAFSHNPFSMPQGGLAALNGADPLQVKAYQYDIVCNGVELSSGAIRNHRPDIMLRAFALAGYSAEEVEARFGGMMNAFRYGAPPHGGLAPGIDRMVMQIAQEQNIREVIAFPMNQQAQDLLMEAPAPVGQKQLDELHLALVPPKPAGDAP